MKRQPTEDTYSFGDERPRMTRAELIKTADFWRRCELRWQAWAKTLLKDPPDGMWGDDMSRELLRMELQYHRSTNDHVPPRLRGKHEKRAERNITRRLAKAIGREHVARRGKALGR